MPGQPPSMSEYVMSIVLPFNKIISLNSPVAGFPQRMLLTTVVEEKLATIPLLELFLMVQLVMIGEEEELSIPLPEFLLIKQLVMVGDEEKL